MSRQPQLESVPSHRLVREGVRCQSSGDKHLGYFGSVRECSHACAITNGCRYFIYSASSEHCYQQLTTSSACPEGWEADEHDFYEEHPNPAALMSNADEAGACTDLGACQMIANAHGSHSVWEVSKDQEWQHRAYPGGCFVALKSGAAVHSFGYNAHAATRFFSMSSYTEAAQFQGCIFWPGAMSD